MLSLSTPFEHTHAIFSREVVVLMVAHVKEGLYHDRYLAHVFLPHAIEVFGCFHE